MHSGFPIFVVDAFSDRPFAGNPAAVVLCSDLRSADAWMQLVAAEMRHSETAFVAPRADGAFDLRWFTPETEVDLCGHATLASAHVLFKRDRLSAAAFHTRSGVLHAESVGDGIRLDFPTVMATAGDPPSGLLAALGLDHAVACARSDFYALVQVADAMTVRALAPDSSALLDVDTPAVIVTAPGDEPNVDIVSRVFGPRVGIPEDPVTGSAHCVLAPWWSERLGRNRLHAHQASPRGGSMTVTLAGDRVFLDGRAVTVLEGQLP